MVVLGSSFWSGLSARAAVLVADLLERKGCLRCRTAAVPAMDVGKDALLPEMHFWGARARAPARVHFWRSRGLTYLLVPYLAGVAAPVRDDTGTRNLPVGRKMRPAF